MAAPESMAPLILGLVWSITGLSLVFLSMRVFIKWKYRGSLWYDDWVLIFSISLLFVNAGLIQTIVKFGYGQHIEAVMADNPLNVRWIITYLQVVSAVIRLSTTTARISYGITLLRLSNPRQQKFVWFAIGSLLIVITPSLILPFVSCIPYEKIFNSAIPGTCMSHNASLGYFIFEGGYTALVDFALVILPWRILAKLQIRRVEKLGASIALSLGALSGVVTIVKVVYTNEIDNYDFTYNSTELTVWNVVEPSSVIIAASIPNLRVFIHKAAANVKATLRLGTSQMGTAGNSGKTRRRTKTRTDDIYLDNVQKTIKAISAGTDKRRGEGTAWITSQPMRDDDSEKSILCESRAIPSAGIVQVNTFAIEYPDDSHSASTREGQ
ncbi:hypothetical protein F4802DRAFT_597427 [Xylaria palmicola]|nr:hypothetical protein F4802DRAFT_597427 [Xylaria palmicola]